MSKKARFPKLLRLQGLMKQHEITVEELAKQIGRAISTVSLSNNGWNAYDSMDMWNIKEYINKKSGKNYIIDEIFYN